MFYTGKLHVNDMFDMFVNIFNRSKTSCGQISINKHLRHVGILDILELYYNDVVCSLSSRLRAKKYSTKLIISIVY